MKHKLVLVDDFDFELIGICSSNADYRLCWGINNALQLKLAKDNDYEIRLKKGGVNLYSFYSYFDEEEHIEYYLVKNVSNNYKRLIPEKDQIDYFLIIKNNFTKEINDILTRLKTVDTILTAFTFDPNELKSKEYLIF